MALSKQQQQQVFVILLSVVGLSYVYWTYGLKPVNEKISSLNNSLTEVQDKVETMKRVAERLPALQKEYDNLVAEVGKAEKRLPKQKNLEEVLRIVTRHSQKTGVSVASFTPQGERAQNYYVEVPIDLSIAGQFHTLGEFLTTLGQEERILSARNLQLTYNANPRKGHSVTGTFTLLAYMFKG